MIYPPEWLSNFEPKSHYSEENSKPSHCGQNSQLIFPNPEYRVKANTVLKTSIIYLRNTIAKMLSIMGNLCERLLQWLRTVKSPNPELTDDKQWMQTDWMIRDWYLTPKPRLIISPNLRKCQPRPKFSVCAQSCLVKRACVHLQFIISASMHQIFFKIIAPPS